MSPRDAILNLLAWEGPIEGRQAIYDKLYSQYPDDPEFGWCLILGGPYSLEIYGDLGALIGNGFVQEVTTRCGDRRTEAYSLSDDGQKVVEANDA